MIHNIALFLIFGQPLVMYGGILTFIFILFTAFVGLMNFKKGVFIIPFKWHPRLAITVIVFAIIHAIFGLSILFNF